MSTIDRVAIPLFLMAAISCSLAFDANDTNIANPVTPATVTRTYTATNSSDPADWNAADFKRYFDERGANEGAIGTMQFLIGESDLNKAVDTRDPANLQNDQVMRDPSLATVQSVGAFDDTLRLDIVNTASAGASGSRIQSEADNIRCYITRDIPFYYECSKTGMIYGGSMTEGGAEAKRECQNNCYTQESCVNVNPSATARTDVERLRYSLLSNTTASMAFPADASRILDYLTLEWRAKDAGGNALPEGEPFFIDITFVSSGETRPVVRRFLLQSGGRSKRLYIGEAVERFETRLFRESGTEMEVEMDYSLEYRVDEKWICPSVQDISRENPGSFAYKCPGGTIHTFTAGAITYEICAQKDGYGDNPDGTYSSRSACEAICRISEACTPSLGTFSTTSLQNFREGCIQGQPDCTDADCRLARLTGQKIIDEIVFDATQNYRKTIENSVQIPGSDRPRVLLDLNVTFEERNRQEWKDDAYVAMVQNGTYSMTRSGIGEQSDAKQAYAIGLVSGASYGVTGSSRRVLYWLLSPRALDVNVGKTLYLYMLMKVDLEHYGVDLSGNKIMIRDQVWYIKTSPGDSYKPVRRALDYAKVVGGTVDTAPAIEINAYASFRDETFSSGGWFAFNTGMLADYFDTMEFSGDRAYWRIPVIDSIGSLPYLLPGMVRRRDTSGPLVTPVYTGDFEGSGDGLAKYQVYVIYSENPLTYAELYDRIDSGEMVRIFESGNEEAYPKILHSDVEGQFDGVDIFRYGPENNTSIIMRIRPRDEDIGKKAFIYVFVQ